MLLGALLYVLLNIISRTLERRKAYRPYYFAPIFIIAMALGCATFLVHQPPTLPLHKINGTVGYGTIENIEFKEQSTYMVVKMKSEYAQGTTIRLTTRGCNYQLREGDNIAFSLALQPIGDTHMPGDADFATLLKRKGLIYSQHIDVDAVVKYGHTSSFMSRMAHLRRNLKNAVYTSSISSTAKHYIIALILGDKKHIDRQTQNEYAHAGLSHLLALSGLHIGIMMTLIWLILWPLDFYRLKKWRFVLSLAIVILYDCLTGLPPSVVRATIMIGFSFSTFIFGRKSSAINALMASALVILAFSPESLFNAGFQLSFITVLFILLLATNNQLLRTNHAWLSYILSLIAISIIASIATTALTAYHFHSISWAGVVANLLSIPVFTIFMGVAVVIIMLAVVNVNIEIVSQVADAMVSYLQGVASTVSAIPGAYSEEVYFSSVDVAVYFACALLLILFFKFRKWRYFNLSIAICAVGIVLHSVAHYRVPREGCVLTASFHHTPIIFYHLSTAYYWVPDDNRLAFNPDEFRDYHSGFFAKHGISHFVEATDSTAIENTVIHAPIAYIYGKTFLVAGRKRWKRVEASKKLDIDYCVITRNFNSTIAELDSLYHIKCVVVSGDVYEPNIHKLARQCNQMGIPFHDLREHTLVVQ
ncbi:MAG: ComEC/Rec2 family competence protein [Sodaliphilus sp.]